MKKLLLLAIFIVAITADGFAQKTINLQPDAVDGKDAVLSKGSPNNNYGSYLDIDALAWTNGGESVTLRSLIDFDLSAIPFGSKIKSATLFLYNNYNSRNCNGEHQSLSGSNVSVLQRIIEPWEEGTVTWNNQPAITSNNEVTVPMSTSEHQDYSINVTKLVQDMVDYYSSSYGFMLKLVTEDYYRCLIFASSDNENASLHPKLEITYEDPTPCRITVYDTVKIEKVVEVYDTIKVEKIVEVYDTIPQYISVQDTLVIDVWLTSVTANKTSATVKVYPNPTFRDLNIYIQDPNLLLNHKIDIVNSKGQSVFLASIKNSEYTVSFDEFIERGLYLVNILDPNYQIIETKKILLK